MGVMLYLSFFLGSYLLGLGSTTHSCHLEAFFFNLQKKKKKTFCIVEIIKLAQKVEYDIMNPPMYLLPHSGILPILFFVSSHSF